MRRRRSLFALAVLVGCGGSGAGGGDDDDDDGGGGPDATALVCDPAAGGARWLEEGETLVAPVACATGADPGPDGFTVDGLPAGATYNAESRTITFSPALDQAAVYKVALGAPAVGETGELTIGVADRFDDPANVPVVDPAAYPEEFGLPVFFLSPTPTDSELYQPVTVVYGGRSYAIEGKLRGASSLSYPKKSFTLNFDGDLLDDPARGLVGEKKIVLTTSFDDNSYLRVQLAWELWNRLGPAMPVASTPAVVYLDGVYQGLYTVSDHVDDELAASHGLPEDGNLYKAVNHNANFALTAIGGGDKATLHDGYEKKHGLPDPGQPGAFDDLEDLVDFVATASDADFAAEIGARVHLPDFEAWWMFAVFTRAQDSAGKNSYLHHSATTPWHVVPWDFNETFGQSWYTTREPYAPVYLYEGHNRLFARLITHPELAGPTAARFAAELGDGGALELAWVQARIDALAAELTPSALRDQRRWRDEYLAFSRWSFRDDFTEFEGEVAYVREWITNRWTALQ